MHRQELPTQEYLQKCFLYKEGRLYWLKRPREHFSSDRIWNSWNAKHKNKEAGSCHKYNRKGKIFYRYTVGVNGKHYFRSNIVWKLITGQSLDHVIEIDHINRDTIDDNIDNLRIGTRSQNCMNKTQRKNAFTNYKGVFYRKDCGKFYAKIQIKGKIKWLGYFDSEELAHQAYAKAAIDEYGEYANP